MASLPSNLDFVSFLKYSPHGKSDASLRSFRITHGVKNDGVILVNGDNPERAINYLVNGLAIRTTKHDLLANLFGRGTIVVPMPRSSPQVEGALWPTRRICEEMLKAGLVG